MFWYIALRIPTFNTIHKGPTTQRLLTHRDLHGRRWPPMVPHLQRCRIIPLLGSEVIAGPLMMPLCGD